MRRAALIATATLAVCTLAACGGPSGGEGGGGGGADAGGPVTLNWWAYNEPSGSFRKAAEQCTKDSGGRYEIVFNPLGNDPDTQRQSLVRRLAARDDSIDLMSMDVVWTGEFAEAEWIRPWPETYAAPVREGTLDGPLATATYEGRLYAAPANSNTQLLWYRKDLVERPPATWDEMITQAERLPEAGRIGVTGAAYEGTTVWFNSLVVAAGGTVLDGPTKPGTDRQAFQKAVDVMHRLATSKAADPSLPLQKEDQVRTAFQEGSTAFQVNYPFIYASAKDEAPDFVEKIGWAPFPAVTEGRRGAAPIGGFNWGVSSYTKHPTEAFEAATCLRNEKSQRGFAIDGGLPPTLSKIYDDRAFVKDYPFADLVRRQLDAPAVRPVSPVYADVSLGIYTALSPAGDIDTGTIVGELMDKIRSAVESKGLL